MTTKQQSRFYQVEPYDPNNDLNISRDSQELPLTEKLEVILGSDNGVATNLELGLVTEPLQSSASLKSIVDALHEMAENGALSRFQLQSYAGWLLRFSQFIHNRSLLTVTESDISDYLNYLVVVKNYHQLQQRSAELALRFVFSKFLNITFRNLHVTRRVNRRGFFSRFQKSHLIPVLEHLPKASQLICQLVLETELRLKQALRIRIADVDFKKNCISIRDQNGDIQYQVLIPLALILDIKIQTMKVKRLVQEEKERLYDDNEYHLYQLAQQLEPEWQYLFPICQSIPAQDKLLRLNQFPFSLLLAQLRYAKKRASPIQSNSKQLRVAPNHHKEFPTTHLELSLLAFNPKEKNIHCKLEQIKAMASDVRQPSLNFSFKMQSTHLTNVA